MTDVPVAELRQVSRGYRTGGGAVVAVDGVSLTLARGQVLGIAGPSGAGKSTLLRLIAGIERPDRGEVQLAGTPAWPGRRRTARYPRPGYVMPVFQDPFASLNPRWPIWRSITEPLTVPDRRPADELRASAERWLAEAGLAHLDPATPPGELSGGQCQRVAILRALIAGPALVVADEPIARQDVITAAAVAQLFRRAAERGTTVVVVSHDKPWLDRTVDSTLALHPSRPGPDPRGLNGRTPSDSTAKSSTRSDATTEGTS